MAKNKALTMDYDEHKRTYAGFVNLIKWVVIGVIFLLVLMAVFLL